MNQSNTPSRKPHKPRPTDDSGEPGEPGEPGGLAGEKFPVDNAATRRQFVRSMAKKAAYVAPVVIALTANKTAFASVSGAPS